MRLVRRAVVPAGGALLAAVLAVGPSASRGANPVPLGPAAACAAAADAGPWKAVFGTRPTLATGLGLFRKAEHAGFKNLAMIQAAPNRVEIDLFGIATYRIGLELVREARSAFLQVSIQPSRDRYCPDEDADWEGVFGHRTTVAAAISLRTAVVKAGFVSAQIERDGLRNYEVEVAGLRTLSQGREFQAEGRSAGYRVTLERS